MVGVSVQGLQRMSSKYGDGIAELQEQRSACVDEDRPVG